MTGKKIKIENQETITLAPKQKLIQIHRVHELGYDFKAIEEILGTLKHSGALKIYLYLSSHKNGLIWALSSAELDKKHHIKQEVYKNGVKELIEKGYLVPGAIYTGYEEINNAQTYHFYESLELKNSLYQEEDYYNQEEEVIPEYRSGLAGTVGSNNRVRRNYGV